MESVHPLIHLARMINELTDGVETEESVLYRAFESGYLSAAGYAELMKETGNPLSDEDISALKKLEGLYARSHNLASPYGTRSIKFFSGIGLDLCNALLSENGERVLSH